MGPEPPQALPVRRINGLDGPRGHVVLRLVNRLRLAIRPAPPISLFCCTTRARVDGQNAQKAKIARYAGCEHNRDAVRADP